VSSRTQEAESTARNIKTELEQGKSEGNHATWAKACQDIQDAYRKDPGDFASLLKSINQGSSNAQDQLSVKKDSHGQISEIDLGQTDIYKASRTQGDGKSASGGDHSGEKSGNEANDTMADFENTSSSLFGRLDKNKTGYINKAQLGEAIQDPQYNGKEAATVAALYANYANLKTSDKGISRGDLDQFTNRENQASDDFGKASDARDWAKSKFTDQLTNNGSISVDTLTKYSQQHPNMTEEEKSSLTYLQATCEQKGSGITLNDMNSDVQEKEKVWQNLAGDVNYTYEHTMEREKENSTALYADSKQPLNSIKADAVNQRGSIGDCAFESSLASLATAHPEQIQKMIKDNGSGTYTVTFPGDANHPVTVNAPTAAEHGLYDSGSKYGNWASTMEKAYGEYQKENPYACLGEPHNPYAGNVAQEHLAEGGSPYWSMYILTGKQTSYQSVKDTSDNELANRLSQSNTDKMVVAGVANNGHGQTTIDLIEKDHAYSVVGFDKYGSDGGTVTLRNPHGLENDSENPKAGTFNISLKRFKQVFTDLFEES
jgi:Calpain family cysteine protease